MTPRRSRTTRATLGILSITASTLLLASCGGGGGGGKTPPTPSGPTITTASLPNAFTDYGYDSGPLRATGGSPPYEWSATSLPPGLVLSVGMDWQIQGYPTELGAFSATLQVRDSNFRTASRTLNITVKKGMYIVLGELPESRVNLPFSHTFQTTGGVAPFTWSWVGSSWSGTPPGLSMGSEGVLSGTPTAGGYFVFDVSVRDADGQVATVSYLGITIRSLQIISQSLSPAYQHEEYTSNLEAIYGDAPLAWSLDSGSNLPPGMALSSAGFLHGTPTSAGANQFIVNVQDASLQTASAQLYLQVLAPVEIATASLPDGNIATPYQAQLNATGGLGWYNWSIEPGGSLPQGTALDGSGWLTGTPTVAGTFDFTVRATSGERSATRTLRLFIDNKLAVLTTSLPDAVSTGQYASTVQALGGTPPYAWSRTGGTAGPEFTINSSTGTITAVPNQTGTFSISLKVTDSSLVTQTATRTLSVRVLPPPSFTTKSLPQGALEWGYNATVSIDGGLAPLTLRVVDGSLPQGLIFVFSGWEPYFYIRGTPTAEGEFSFTFELADSSSPSLTVTQGYTIRINKALRIATESLPDGNMGDAYFATLEATGGVLPYSWDGYPPKRLTVNPGGNISGVPEVPSNYNVHVNIRDATGRYIGKTIPLKVTAHPRIRTTRLPQARLDVPYRVSLSGTAWYGPLSWTMTSGKLPAGLTLDNSTGEISGTPTIEETDSFTVRFQDGATPPEFDERALNLGVVEAPGRNDSPATATPISNGTFRASISPYADPVAGPAKPDHDYYQLTAAPGAMVTIETTARRLVPASFLDTVLEIVDMSGTRLSNCPSPYGYFDGPCLNDDIQLGIIQDSHLEIKIPGEGSSPVTMYVHVFSFNGSARPDHVYDLTVSGAN